MKIEFKNHNYVANIRKTKDLEKRVKLADGNEQRLASVLLSVYEDKANRYTGASKVFFYIAGWGISYYLARVLDIFGETEITNMADSVLAGITAICLSSGIITRIGAVINDKKYDEVFEIFKEETNSNTRKK